MLAEVVKRIDGREFDQFAKEMIFLPLQMPDCSLGISTKSDSKLARFKHFKALAPLYKVPNEQRLEKGKRVSFRCLVGSKGSSWQQSIIAGGNG